MEWESTMEYHRYCDIWPLMEGAEFEKLKADIRDNGLRVAITTYRGKILDGRNRDRACAAVGITPRYEDSGINDDDTALIRAVSLNERRRHMSVAQRAFAAEKLANIINGHNRFRDRVVGIPAGIPTSATRSLQRAADMLGVSRGSAARARTIRTHGTEADVADVIAGRGSLNERAVAVRPVQNPRPPRTRRGARTQSTPAPSPAPDRASGRPLSPEQVDPGFTGTRDEYTAVHGHVSVHTAEQKAVAYLGTITTGMRKAMRVLQETRHPPELYYIDYWLGCLRSPNERDVAKLREALEVLEPRLEEAKAWLDRAEAVLRDRPALNGQAVASA
jgi:hypothetical protein